MNQEITRCPWCGNDPLYVRYHDEEWGSPIHDDQTLFEFLTLEGVQAGLSWITVLRKRENYRKNFLDWDIEKIANMDDEELERLLGDSGIIRNRLKVYSVRKNAQVTLQIQKDFGSLSEYFWSFVDGKPILNTRINLSDLPAESDISAKISKDLKKRGMSFIGSTILYAFMQAVGMVDDHIDTCFRKKSPQ